MGNPRYQTRLPSDDAERVDEYVRDRDISQSEAVRRLIRAGLETVADDEEDGDDRAGAVERARQNGTLPFASGVGVGAVLTLVVTII